MRNDGLCLSKCVVSTRRVLFRLQPRRTLSHLKRSRCMAFRITSAPFRSRLTRIAYSSSSCMLVIGPPPKCRTMCFFFWEISARFNHCPIQILILFVKMPVLALWDANTFSFRSLSPSMPISQFLWKQAMKNVSQDNTTWLQWNEPSRTPFADQDI